MRCPKCRTLTLASAGDARGAGRLERCPRCPAIWVARPEDGGAIDLAVPPPVTRRGPLIIEGRAAPAGLPPRRPRAASSWFHMRRYRIAAGAAVLALALGVALLAPDVSALPGLALLEGSR